MDSKKTEYRAMEKIVVKVLDYTETPGPRFIQQGAFSGEEFYVTILNPKMAECIQNGLIMEIVLDGTAGYPSSFLDQAFGELVYDFSEEIVKQKVKFDTKMYNRRVNKLFEETYPQWEKRRREKLSIHDERKRNNLYYIDDNGVLLQRIR